MRIFLLLFLLFCTQGVSIPVAYAQKKSAGTADLLEKKSKLEELISQRLKSTIATTLDKNAFDVSVQVVLEEIKKTPKAVVDAAKKRESAKAEVPQDLTVGLIDADAVIRRYEEQVEALQAKQTLLMQKVMSEMKEAPSDFVIKSMHVFVGVAEGLGDKYAKDLEDWVKKTLAADTGIKAVVKVSLIKAAPKETEKPKTTYDYISDYQQLLGYFMMAVTLVILMFIFKMMGSKDATENRKLTAQLQQNMKMIQEEKPLEFAAEKELPALESPAMDAVELEILRDLKTKIVYSATENVQSLNEIFHSWLEGGERGYQKSASLMEILVSLSGNNGMSGRGVQFQWDMLIPESARKKMRMVFEKMSVMKPSEKIKILEEVSWDLISIKTLGADSLTQPFQFVSAIPARDIQNLLTNQNPQMKALVVMHMADETREEYLQNISYDSKRELIEQSLQMDQVLVTDIATASEALKFEVNKHNSTDAATISIKSLAPILLSSIKVMDEINLLKEIARKNAAAALSLKQSYPSLAFIGEWPDDKAKTFIALASADEILALLRMLPETKDKILPLCALKVQAIVGDDFAKQDHMDVISKERNLGSLKLKMLQILNKGSVRLEDIFPVSEQNNPGGLRAAS